MEITPDQIVSSDVDGNVTIAPPTYTVPIEQLRQAVADATRNQINAQNEVNNVERLLVERQVGLDAATAQLDSAQATLDAAEPKYTEARVQAGADADVSMESDPTISS